MNFLDANGLDLFWKQIKQLVQDGQITSLSWDSITNKPDYLLDSTGIDWKFIKNVEINWDDIQNVPTHLFDEEYIKNIIGTWVTVNQIEKTGTKIATINVAGTSTDIYAPEAGDNPWFDPTDPSELQLRWTDGMGTTLGSNWTTVDVAVMEMSLGSTKRAINIQFTGGLSGRMHKDSTGDVLELSGGVSFSSGLQTGVNIGTLTVGDTKYTLYAPQAGQQVVQKLQYFKGNTNVTDHTSNQTSNTPVKIGLSGDSDVKHRMSFISQTSGLTIDLIPTNNEKELRFSINPNTLFANVDINTKIQTPTISATFTKPNLSITIGVNGKTATGRVDLSKLIEGLTGGTGGITQTEADGRYIKRTGDTGMTGNYTFQGNINAAAFYENSDRRLKTDIHDVEDFGALEVKYHDFLWKESGEKSTGVIADELKQIYPELVKDRGDGYEVVDYITLHNKQIAALMKKINELEEEIKTLKNHGS